MKTSFVARCCAVLACCAPAIAFADFHLFRIQQIYSNADGTLQYVLLQESQNQNNEHKWGGQQLTAIENGVARSFLFPGNLSGTATAKKYALAATSAFYRLGLVTPDFIIPDGFIPRANGQIDFAGVDALAYDTLPQDGDTALDRTGGTVSALARNFAGATYAVPFGLVVTPPPPNYQGLWWNAPAGSESGWGINFAHQGDTIFATWFTHDAQGKPLWLALLANKTGPDTYAGDVFTTTGPPFNAVPFDPALVVETTVGSATITFSDETHATFAYTLELPDASPLKAAIAQTKNLVRQDYTEPVPKCAWKSNPNLANTRNYQDLWWNSPGSSESGWGINLTHQGNLIFATWFTYDANGKPWWLAIVASPVRQGVYQGDFFTTTGPALDAEPFDSSSVVETTVGTGSFIFNTGNNAIFEYTVNGVHQTKTIVRQVFTAPGTACQ